VLGRVNDVRTNIRDGDLLLLDANNGTLDVRPPMGVQDAFESKLQSSQKRRASQAALRDQPTITKDGIPIELMINAGLREDITALDLTGASGIGLFRTEFQFLVSATLPQRERQQRLYRDVLDAAGDRPVIFRTVDIGGDKPLPYMTSKDTVQEENPAMGWRALRLSLDREGLLKVQARALLEAAAGRTLNVMFPMVAEPWEYAEARDLFVHQREWLRNRGKKLPCAVRYGAMLEVPGLIETLDLMLPHLDFLSIGTNDLTQFLFAADRANPRLAERYDWLSPTVMRYIARVVKICDGGKVPVGVCGEMGGRPLEAMALLGAGIRRLSITPAGVGPVKAMIRSLDLSAILAEMPAILGQPSTNPRQQYLDLANRHNVELSIDG
jgi:phosphotransferase system enzyme I (PtsP)